MANAIKYSTESETLALKKGNFYIGTGDVGKGPTSMTGYYNGITPPSGGYTIYLNKATGGPSIYTCANDTELISLTNSIAGTSYVTANECFNYFNGQTDKLILSEDISEISTNGLVMYLDGISLPSYPKNGTSWTNLTGNGSNASLVNGTIWNSNGYMTTDGINDRIDVSRPWTPELSTDYYTIEVWFRPKILPTAQFSTNSPVFGARIGSDYMIFLYPASSSQSKIGVSYDDSRYNSSHQSTYGISANEWIQFVHVGIPYVYNGYNRGKLKYYVNGVLDKDTFDSADTNGYSIPNPFYVGYDARWGAYSNLDMGVIRIYDRELTSDEVLQNFNAQKDRFGL